MKTTIGTAANRNLSAASMSGEVSPTPTLIAIKLRPQTIATLNAARMSRAVISRTGARRRREGGLGGKRSGEACPLELACREASIDVTSRGYSPRAELAGRGAARPF